MVVTNTYNSLEPTLMLTDLDAINEFFSKDNECYVRFPGITNNTQDYFMFHNGERGMKGRTTFSSFFNHENIKSIFIDVQKIMLNRFVELKKEWEG